MTPSQAGDLNVEGADRDTPPRAPGNLLPSSLRPANSGLGLVLRESPLAKASAGAEFLEGPQKGQDLGEGVRCPCMAGFETRPPDLTPTSLGTSSPPRTCAPVPG